MMQHKILMCGLGMFKNLFARCDLKLLTAFGQFHSLAPMYYRGSAAAVIVYDITKQVRVSSDFRCHLWGLSQRHGGRLALCESCQHLGSLDSVGGGGRDRDSESYVSSLLPRPSSFDFSSQLRKQ